MKPFMVLLAVLIPVAGIPVNTCHAQDGAVFNERIDSLKNQLAKTAEGPDKFKLYGEISWEYIVNSEYALGLQYADSIRQAAQRLKDEEGIAYSRFYYGVISRFKGDYADALEQLTGFLNYHVNSGDSARVAAGLFQIAVVQSTIGNYSKALSQYYRLIAIHEDNDFSQGVAYTLNAIGVVYRKMKKPQHAILAYTKAIAIYEELDAPQDKADAINNLANVYTDLSDYGKALSLYHQALELDSISGYARGIAYDLENIGNLYNRMGKPDSALTYQLQALAIRRQLDEKYEIAISTEQTGQTYLLLKKHHEAEPYLLQGLAMAEELGSKPLLNDLFATLATLYAEKQDYQQAFQYQTRHLALQDSIFSEETARQVNELQARYETEKKDQQIAFLDQERKAQEADLSRQRVVKWGFVGLAIVMAILAGFLLYIYRQRLRNQRMLNQKEAALREANFKRKLSELEMKALQAQVNPHFIFNCLNSINLLILKGDNEGASGYLAKFSRLVRLMLEHAESSEVSLKAELMLLEAYIQLEALRFRGKIAYQLEIEKDVDPEENYLPPMILQPFVENAIWHGLMPRDQLEPGLIRLRISKAEDKLLCEIEDNGVGRKSAMNQEKQSVWKGKSLGLKITEERLNLMHREDHHEFITITDLEDEFGNPQGTSVVIRVPLN